MENSKLILIVEDEEPIVRVLTDKLQREGYKVISAPDGKQGLAMALEHKPDMILLDIVMPIMDGISALKALRQDAWGKDVEVMILTNLTDPAKNAEAIEKGVFEYLIKTDWDLVEVINKVRERLANKRE
jgi:two-component system alkaline phosphatase synthesis response regulator PhoP